jgi:hypothetical protein
MNTSSIGLAVAGGVHLNPIHNRNRSREDRSSPDASFPQSSGDAKMRILGY